MKRSAGQSRNRGAGDGCANADPSVWRHAPSRGHSTPDISIINTNIEPTRAARSTLRGPAGSEQSGKTRDAAVGEAEPVQFRKEGLLGT